MAGKMGTAVVQCLYNLPAGEHSVFPYPFNDDLGEHGSPLRVYECKEIYKRRIDSTIAIIFHSPFSIPIFPCISHK